MVSEEDVKIIVYGLACACIAGFVTHSGSFIVAFGIELNSTSSSGSEASEQRANIMVCVLVISKSVLPVVLFVMIQEPAKCDMLKL